MTHQLARREKCETRKCKTSSNHWNHSVPSLFSGNLQNTHYRSYCRSRTRSSNSFKLDTKDCVTTLGMRESALAKMFVTLAGCVDDWSPFSTTKLHLYSVTSESPVKRSPSITSMSKLLWCNFYRAMLCIRGTSHGPVSVCPSICPSQVGVLLKRLNVGLHKQNHTIPQGL